MNSVRQSGKSEPVSSKEWAGRVAVIAFSNKGADTARIIAQWAGTNASLRPRDALEAGESREQPLREWTQARFKDAQALVFVGSAGIAVRAIAPHIRSKDVDPAVVVIDESARFVIPLLSGHLGAANALGKELATLLGANLVLTTASDTRGSFAVDEWARRQGYYLEDVKRILPVTSAILDGEGVGFYTDAPGGIRGALPEGLRLAHQGRLGICLSPRLLEPPFEKTLLLRPRVLTLGVGCKRDTSASVIRAAISDFLHKNKYAVKSVSRIASIDLKQNEPGLLEVCNEENWQFTVHSREALERADYSEGFTQSDFVQSITGVDCVCERAAALHGKLIVKKTCYQGVTIALSCANWEVRFDES